MASMRRKQKHRPGEASPATGREPRARVVAEFSSSSSREVVNCRVCGRTLLLGERSVGFFTEAGDGPFDVCELCVPRAPRFGLRPRPSTPDELSSRSRSRRGTLPRLRLPVRRSRRSTAAAAALKPVGAAAVPVALAAFNDSEHARTLAGLYKTLGEPTASVVPRSATDRDVILTVAWEIVWYQFRIAPDEIESRRGTYLSELEPKWRRWNCSVTPDGRVGAPDPTTEAPVTADTPRQLPAELATSRPAPRATDTKD